MELIGVKRVGTMGSVPRKGSMERRLGFVGIIIENRKKAAPAVNSVLSEFGDVVVGRMGIPHAKKNYSVIALIVDATTDEVGALTGKLGEISGVSVKSALSRCIT